MSAATASGSCFCGAVSFAVQLPTKWVVHCHCQYCRRAQATAFMTWVGVEATQASISAPGRVLRWFAPTPNSQRGFCARCGTPLFFRSTKWPAELHIARGSFVDPVDRRPKIHVHFDQHVDWFEVIDGLPKL